jgi:hypothetical protein
MKRLFEFIAHQCRRLRGTVRRWFRRLFLRLAGEPAQPPSTIANRCGVARAVLDEIARVSTLMDMDVDAWKYADEFAELSALRERCREYLCTAPFGLAQRGAWGRIANESEILDIPEIVQRFDDAGFSV